MSLYLWWGRWNLFLLLLLLFLHSCLLKMILLNLLLLNNVVINYWFIISTLGDLINSKKGLLLNIYWLVFSFDITNITKCIIAEYLCFRFIFISNILFRRLRFIIVRIWKLLILRWLIESIAITWSHIAIIVIIIVTEKVSIRGRRIA